MCAALLAKLSTSAQCSNVASNVIEPGCELSWCLLAPSYPERSDSSGHRLSLLFSASKEWDHSGNDGASTTTGAGPSMCPRDGELEDHVSDCCAWTQAMAGLGSTSSSGLDDECYRSLSAIHGIQTATQRRRPAPPWHVLLKNCRSQLPHRRGALQELCLRERACRGEHSCTDGLVRLPCLGRGRMALTGRHFPFSLFASGRGARASLSVDALRVFTRFSIASPSDDLVRVPSRRCYAILFKDAGLAPRGCEPLGKTCFPLQMCLDMDARSAFSSFLAHCLCQDCGIRMGTVRT
ncbi:hypothetical protein HPB50_022196 [Hyalomma asiaticum]|uniref:Uncharacterized protein n=1 Tax=Hyalomma asiaticum TaxID=266040 RepID=A0ACB7T8K8_HYAAI|nr:hypothetical protein HPB50_022196 [Hyalomma asiaticum]